MQPPVPLTYTIATFEEFVTKARQEGRDKILRQQRVAAENQARQEADEKARQLEAASKLRDTARDILGLEIEPENYTYDLPTGDRIHLYSDRFDGKCLKIFDPATTEEATLFSLADYGVWTFGAKRRQEEAEQQRRAMEDEDSHSKGECLPDPSTLTPAAEVDVIATAYAALVAEQTQTQERRDQFQAAKLKAKLAIQLGIDAAPVTGEIEIGGVRFGLIDGWKLAVVASDGLKTSVDGTDDTAWATVGSAIADAEKRASQPPSPPPSKAERLLSLIEEIVAEKCPQYGE